MHFETDTVVVEDKAGFELGIREGAALGEADGPKAATSQHRNGRSSRLKMEQRIGSAVGFNSTFPFFFRNFRKIYERTPGHCLCRLVFVSSLTSLDCFHSQATVENKSDEISW